MVCRSHCCTTVLAVIGFLLLAAGAAFPYEYRVNKTDIEMGDTVQVKQLLLFGFDRVYCVDLDCPFDSEAEKELQNLYCCAGHGDGSELKYTDTHFMPGVGTQQLRVLGNVTLASGVVATLCALLATLAAFMRCCCGPQTSHEQLSNKPSGLLVFVNVLAVVVAVGSAVYYAVRLPHVVNLPHYNLDANVGWFTSLAGSTTTADGTINSQWGPFSLCFTVLGAACFLINTITLSRHRSRAAARDDSMPLVVNKQGNAYNYVESIDVVQYA